MSLRWGPRTRTGRPGRPVGTVERAAANQHCLEPQLVRHRSALHAGRRPRPVGGHLRGGRGGRHRSRGGRIGDAATGTRHEHQDGQGARPDRDHAETLRGTVGAVSTRFLIISALVCGMALLVAFTVQVVMAP